MLNSSKADWVHVLMNSIFVPNMFVGFPILEAIHRCTKKPLYVYLIIVNPGFGGQEFIEHTYKKVEYDQNLIDKTGSKVQIEVDGGVNLRNAKKRIDLGAQILVADSRIFQSINPFKTIDSFTILLFLISI